MCLNTKLQVRNWVGVWKLSSTIQGTDEKTGVILPSGHRVNQWQGEENGQTQAVNPQLGGFTQGWPGRLCRCPSLQPKTFQSPLTSPFWKLQSTVVKHLLCKATSFPSLRLLLQSKEKKLPHCFQMESLPQAVYLTSTSFGLRQP